MSAAKPPTSRSQSQRERNRDEAEGIAFVLLLLYFYHCSLLVSFLAGVRAPAFSYPHSVRQWRQLFPESALTGTVFLSMNCTTASAGIRTQRPHRTAGRFFRAASHARIVAGRTESISAASFTVSSCVIAKAMIHDVCGPALGTLGGFFQNAFVPGAGERVPGGRGLLLGTEESKRRRRVSSVRNSLALFAAFAAIAGGSRPRPACGLQGCTPRA
jgi:hypothetical protein